MKPQRLVPLPEAFSLSGGKQKRPRIEDGLHLKFLRTLPCIICGTHKNVEAAHIRMGSRVNGKPETGMQEKPSDIWAIPLCDKHHRHDKNSQHSLGEQKFWSLHNINPFELALSLFACNRNEESALTVLRETKERAVTDTSATARD